MWSGFCFYRHLCFWREYFDQWFVPQGSCRFPGACPNFPYCLPSTKWREWRVSGECLRIVLFCSGWVAVVGAEKGRGLFFGLWKYPAWRIVLAAQFDNRGRGKDIYLSEWNDSILVNISMFRSMSKNIVSLKKKGGLYVCMILKVSVWREKFVCY